MSIDPCITQRNFAFFDHLVHNSGYSLSCGFYVFAFDPAKKLYLFYQQFALIDTRQQFCAKRSAGSFHPVGQYLQTYTSAA